MSERIVYLAHERPDVEVLWEGAWCPGELRMRSQDAPASGYVWCSTCALAS